MDDALVLYNGELDFGPFKNQYESFVNSFLRLGIKAKAMPSSEFVSALFDIGQEEQHPEVIVFLDKDVNCASLLETRGFRLYNRAECIRLCDDKALTYLTLYKKGLPIPKTIIAPKTYKKPQSEEWCRRAAEVIGYPVVIKECFGSLGMQVYLAENENELLKKIREIGQIPFVIQEFLHKGAGWDIRVITSGGEVIGGIKRSNQTDFRANAARGGTVDAISLTDSQKKLALAAAEATGAFFAGVDLIMGDDDFLVCEVNSNMFFEAAENVLNFSVSDKIVDKIGKHCLNK
ncbi:MAG: RimK family alpha-L-glutamate ligase [Monoglobales bacterium]